MRRIALIAVVAVNVAVALVVWNARSAPQPTGSRPAPASAGPAVADPGWAGLDAQARCDDAVSLVTHPDRWPTRCRWRIPGEGLQGQAFPPPKGPAPYDDPHVEIYVAMSQTREELANAIAHEFGHMHHTRAPTFVADWLAARNLAPDTPSEVWTEDYAEAFASVFSPPAARWRAPTTRPGPDALAALKLRFFS